MSASEPALDVEVDRIVRTETRSPLIAYTPARGALLIDAARRARRVALISTDASQLTEAMRNALVTLGGRWVVRSPGGLRDGMTGRALASIASAFERPGDDDAYHRDALRFMRPDHQQLIVALSIRHRADHAALLGGSVDAIAELTGAPPAGWGAHEPVDQPWDRAAFTARVRSRMPSDSRLTVVGSSRHPLTATVTVRRTAHGIEEIVEAVAGVGPIASHAAEEAIGTLPGLFRSLAQNSRPLIALGFTRIGGSDLATAPFPSPTPQPLVMLIGAPGVRELAIDATAFAQRFGGELVGPSRIPALLLTLRGPDDPVDAGWPALLDIVEALGADVVQRLTGIDFSDPFWQRRSG